MAALLHPFPTCNSSSSMKLRAPSHPPPRVISILSSVFPFKLKYLVLSARPTKEYSRIRNSSRRGVGVRTLALSHGREFHTGSFGGRVGQGKSLVEDKDEGEDELDNVRVRDMGKSRSGFSSQPLKRLRDSGYGNFKNSEAKKAEFFDGFSPPAKRGGRDTVGVIEDVDDETAEDFDEEVIEGVVSLRELDGEDVKPRPRASVDAAESYLSQTR